jgi:hypothetical protein
MKFGLDVTPLLAQVDRGYKNRGTEQPLLLIMLG